MSKFYSISLIILMFLQVMGVGIDIDRIGTEKVKKYTGLNALAGIIVTVYYVYILYQVIQYISK